MPSEVERRYAVIAALRAGRSAREIIDFFGYPRALVYRLKKAYDEADDKEDISGERKSHSRRSDSHRNEEFLSTLEGVIEDDPSKSMGALAKEMGVAKSTIHKAVHEDLDLISYKLRRRHLLTEKTKDTRLAKARALLNELKDESVGMLRFFSDEKNFVQDMRVNVQNDRWLCSDPSDVPVVMRSKMPASVMILGVVSSDGDVMPLHIFQQGLRLNADGYIDVMKTIVVPWMNKTSAGRPYVFQKDSAPAHKAKKTQAWLLENVPHHVDSMESGFVATQLPRLQSAGFFCVGRGREGSQQGSSQHNGISQDFHRGDNGTFEQGVSNSSLCHIPSPSAKGRRG